MSEQNFASTFAEAFLIEQQEAALARALQEKLKKEKGADGIAAYREELKIVPLAGPEDIASLKAMWRSVPEEKFDETELTPSSAPFLGSLDKRLSRYHATLKNLFPCPGEVDSKDVFWDIASKGNFDSSLQEEIGPFRDFSLMLVDPKTDAVLGGVDFCVYVHHDGPATVQTNFTFLTPENRGIRLMSKLLEAQDKTALAFIKETRPDALKHGAFYGITEQNVPEAMDAETYILDKAHSMDPIKRLRIWGARQYARLNFNYVQPALGEDEDPCDFLSLNASMRKLVVDADGSHKLGDVVRPDSVPAKTLQNHLKAFFTQSIDGDPNDPTAHNVMSRLDKAVAQKGSITTVSASEQKAYLDAWEKRLESLRDAWAAQKPPEGTTITDLYQQLHDARALLKPERKASTTPHATSKHTSGPHV